MLELWEGVVAMRYYDGASVDKQKRVCLGGFIQPNEEYVIYMMDGDERIYVEAFSDQAVPGKSIRKSDAKCRIILPKCFVGNATRVLIGQEKDGPVVLRPM